MKTLACIIAACLIVMGASVLFLPQKTTAQQTHEHLATPTNIIDGRVHPELIPDSVAYRLYLLSISVGPNATEQDRNVQAAHLASSGGKYRLKPNDSQAIAAAAANFRNQYEAWRSRWDAAATAQGLTFDPSPFLQQREDIVQAARDELKHSLSTSVMLQLDAHIQSEKRFMKTHSLK